MAKQQRQIKIAFGGRMGSGKDTAADYLCRNYTGAKHSFAAPLYDIMYYAQKKCGFELKKDRKLLQFIGTDWGRSIDPNVWVKTALRTTPATGNVFLSDIRFYNELYALKSNGWKCIKLTREDPDLLRREGTGNRNHISETSLDKVCETEWDFVIINNGTKEDLYMELDKIMHLIK